MAVDAPFFFWADLIETVGYKTMEDDLVKRLRDPEGWCFADVQRAADRIEELEAMPKYHHPDCNWWKWDWRYSWDKTDCICDDAAGPSVDKP